ncbi:hypothetical protein [Mesorhizobium captivum]|uniref:hypothetical protein n=1 Tax=Mesorhizobium captivum TaxID=3072319 RepID=UPI002A241811|nr:hypothetical protein [Mesorhizobium sp. VK22B]
MAKFCAGSLLQETADSSYSRPPWRYAHSESYVRRVLAASRLSILSLENTVIRHERGEPMEGLAVVTGKAIRFEGSSTR